MGWNDGIFAREGLELESLGPVRARSLSSFTYARKIAIARSRLFFAAGVEVIEVDPACAPGIGRGQPYRPS
ncbi:hypothetical protein [Candidatus Methylacidithermus pantelleriae]|uniref:hypothetical protein n=1 Tax=Candidatus Methylacidithermus pantelleriae TaxID=2744239 RepID=UPI001BD24096|nr:hypothetical protein [Candidatus Methylacidithermus pantelleriae]